MTISITVIDVDQRDTAPTPDLSSKARRAWARKRLKTTGLGRWFLWLISPLVISALVYVSLDQQQAASAGWRIVLYTIATFVSVTAIEWVLLISFGASKGLRDEFILGLTNEIARLRAAVPQPVLVDVEISLRKSIVYGKAIYRDYWLVTIPCYIINHMQDRNAILRFELHASSNGFSLQTHDDLFSTLHKAGNLRRIRRCLPNPKDAAAGGNWGDPLGFLVRGTATEPPAVQTLFVIVTEEHSKRRYRVWVPGECNLATDDCLG